MSKVCLVVSDYLENNKIFEPDVHRDNILDRFRVLKEKFNSHGYDIATHDINSVESSDIVIYASNMPKTLPKAEHINKSYLILSESAFIRPENYDTNRHKYFKKIFTWSDDLVDQKKYIKLNYAHAFPNKINKNLQNKRKLITLISGNKKPRYKIEKSLAKLDLYSERERAIRWFEKHRCDDFDLYGVGWDKYQFSGPRWFRALGRIPKLPHYTQLLLGATYPSYRGVVEHKKPVLEQYRFSVCYENAMNIPGYITEKIFDSFFAGCVPVYLGASNINDYIPGNCFVDKRNFSNYDSLYSYLSGMSDEAYLDILDNIEVYLKSSQSAQFRSEFFADVLLKNIIYV